MTRGRTTVLACTALLVAAGAARADPLDEIVESRIAPALPPELGVAKVHVPASLARLDFDPATVAVEPPRGVRAGRSSYRVTIRGRAAIYLPVTIGKLAVVAIARRDLRAGSVVTAADVIVEHRAVDLIAPAPGGSVIGATVMNDVAAGMPIATRDVQLAAPLPRGSQVAVEIRRGTLRIRGTGTLELAARPGEAATARLSHTKTIVRGSLRAPATLVVGE